MISLFHFNCIYIYSFSWLFFIGPWFHCCNPLFGLIWSSVPTDHCFHYPWVAQPLWRSFMVIFPMRAVNLGKQQDDTGGGTSGKRIWWSERQTVKCSLFSSDDWVCGKARLRVDSSPPAVDKPQFALAGRVHSCSGDTRRRRVAQALTRTVWRSLSLHTAPLRTGQSLFSHVSPNRPTSGTLAVGSCRKCDVVLGQWSLQDVQCHEWCKVGSSSVCMSWFSNSGDQCFGGVIR